MGFLLDGLIVLLFIVLAVLWRSPAGFLGAFFAPLYCAGIGPPRQCSRRCFRSRWRRMCSVHRSAGRRRMILPTCFPRPTWRPGRRRCRRCPLTGCWRKDPPLLRRSSENTGPPSRRCGTRTPVSGTIDRAVYRLPWDVRHAGLGRPVRGFVDRVRGSDPDGGPAGSRPTCARPNGSRAFAGCGRCWQRS